jgi:hypothetical protein
MLDLTVSVDVALLSTTFHGNLDPVVSSKVVRVLVLFLSARNGSVLEKQRVFLLDLIEGANQVNPMLEKVD